MRKWWNTFGYIISLAVAWGATGFTIAYTGLFTESPDEAFVRGYFRGAYHAISVVDRKLHTDGRLILSFRENLVEDSNALWQEWMDEVDRERRRDSLVTIVDSMETPWFWSDSAVMNDEHWICPNDEGWGFLPSCVLRDSLPDVCILRFPDMIIFWDTKLMDSTNPFRTSGIYIESLEE